MENTHLTYLGIDENEVDNNTSVFIWNIEHLSFSNAMSFFNIFFGYTQRELTSSYEKSLFIGDVLSWIAGEQDDQYMIKHYCLSNSQQKLLNNAHKSKQEIQKIIFLLNKFFQNK